MRNNMELTIFTISVVGTLSRCGGAVFLLSMTLQPSDYIGCRVYCIYGELHLCLSPSSSCGRWEKQSRKQESTPAFGLSTYPTYTASPGGNGTSFIHGSSITLSSLSTSISSPPIHKTIDLVLLCLWWTSVLSSMWTNQMIVGREYQLV